jgi:hypothetical protein
VVPPCICVGPRQALAQRRGGSDPDALQCVPYLTSIGRIPLMVRIVAAFKGHALCGRVRAAVRRQGHCMRSISPRVWPRDNMLAYLHIGPEEIMALQ